MEDVHESGYSLKHFTKKFKLPKVVRVVSGIYDMLDEISLSREEILTLHSLKKYETVKASDEEGHTFYLPLNITSKVAITSSDLNDNSRHSYVDVQTLADDFPPLVTSTHAHNWLEIDAGDILKPIQTWITNPRKGYLQCEILNKPLNDDIFIPLSYCAKFEKIETTSHNSLFLKEVVTNYPLPVKVRFLENRVIIQKHDINAGRPTSMDTLGIITLHGQCDLALVVATTIDPDSGKVYSLLNLPQDLDITITPYPGSPKRPKKNDNRLLGFCDKNFVYGSTIIEEKEIEDPESHGYEDVLPRLFPRKKPGAPSRFRHRHSLENCKLKHHENEESCQSNGSHSNDGHDNGKGVEDIVKMEQRYGRDFLDGTQPTGQNTTDDTSESQISEDTTDNGARGTVKSTNELDEELSLDTKVSVDVVKELEKFKASLKLHYPPYTFNQNSPYSEKGSENDSTGDTSKLGNDGRQDGSYGSDSDAGIKHKSNQNLKDTEQKSGRDCGNSDEPLEKNLIYVDIFGAFDKFNVDEVRGSYDRNSGTDVKLQSNQKLKLPGQEIQSDPCNVGEPRETSLDDDDVFEAEVEASNAEKECGDDDDDADKETVVNSTDDQVTGNQEAGDDDGNHSNVSRNDNDTIYDNEKPDRDKDDCSSRNTSISSSTESQYQTLDASTIDSAETRLATLKRLREKRFPLSEDVSGTKHIEHRPRSDLEGYTIPSRLLLEGSESPSSFMRSRTLTDSFLHCADDEEVSSLQTRSIGVDTPDDFKSYLYMNRNPAPSPPQYNTLPASLSKKSKSKSSRKGSLTKLAIFARKGLQRSQSSADVDKYSYAYVESVNNAKADRATEIGKVFDIRKAFKKKSKYQTPLEESLGGLQTTSRDRLQTLDVDQVCSLLKTLSLDRYVKNFREAKIDGSILVDLTDKMMEELQIDKEVDRHKLRKTIDEGWLPKESK